MRALGVGVIYWTDLEPLIRTPDSVVAVVELEPQTLWEKVSTGGGWHYRTNEPLLERVASLSQPKLLHGVGHPFGGTVLDPVDPMPMLRHAIDRLDPAWISEHLSFNRVQRFGGVENAGFLLPPPQSRSAVRVAAHNIQNFRNALHRPVAFETGVNYLRQREGEMDDGSFFADVAQASDCGILLDLHNLWCNERNGRQSVEDALARIPLDRVWEIHVAGGMEESGYWLDAHSGSVPPEVMGIAEKLVPTLPNLGALIFEVLPEHLPRIGLDGVQRQVEDLQHLWRMRPHSVMRPPVTPRGGTLNSAVTGDDIAEVAMWEVTLVNALSGKGEIDADFLRLRADPACVLLGELVLEFRRANLVRAMRYTMTFLLASLGPRDTHAMLNTFFTTHAPEPFRALEADQFAQFLHGWLRQRPDIPYLLEVLLFEHALVRATIHGVASEIAWSADPIGLFESLDRGELPRKLPQVSSTMKICTC